MAFLLSCPDCGPREVTEFSYGGESNKRPSPQATPAELARYLFFRRNAHGRQVEWWYHGDGCQQWLLADRDTGTNAVLSTFRPEDRPAVTPGATSQGTTPA
jgi:heterotetrameric sarcosine oxidase delta subunit